MFFDAHFHYAVCAEQGIFNKEGDLAGENWKALSCAHSPYEWEIQNNSPKSVFRAFGIHPQVVGKIDIGFYKDFLFGLVKKGKLDAIGEAGFDLFSDEFKATREIQEDVWAFQLGLAVKSGLPLVVHCRKGNEMLFRDAGILKKVPVVLFHSFMGSFVEASSLIKRGIKCYFSFGKQMMNNNKKVIDCVKNLPLENLLMETDSPFQTLKGEKNTLPSDIVRIYKAAYSIRYGNGDVGDFNNFCEKLEENGSNLIMKDFL